jgi:hypothetical protein
MQSLKMTFLCLIGLVAHIFLCSKIIYAEELVDYTEKVPILNKPISLNGGDFKEKIQNKMNQLQLNTSKLSNPNHQISFKIQHEQYNELQLERVQIEGRLIKHFSLVFDMNFHKNISEKKFNSEGPKLAIKFHWLDFGANSKNEQDRTSIDLVAGTQIPIDNLNSQNKNVSENENEKKYNPANVNFVGIETIKKMSGGHLQLGSHWNFSKSNFSLIHHMFAVTQIDFSHEISLSLEYQFNKITFAENNNINKKDKILTSVSPQLILWPRSIHEFQLALIYPIKNIDEDDSLDFMRGANGKGFFVGLKTSL